LPDPLLEADLVAPVGTPTLITGPGRARHLWVPVNAFLQGQFEVAA
jgi:hypothetical protein